MFDIVISFEWAKKLIHPSPARDWTISTLIAAVVGLVVLVGAGWVFWSIQSGSIIGGGTQPPKPPTPISRTAIKTVVDAYTDRAANYVARNFVSVNLADPHKRGAKKP